MATRVELIGVTEFRPSQLQPLELDVDGAEALIEFAGRACYQSWEKPNPATATNAGYIANILDHKHFSVIEHSQASFYITGIPRSLTHEFIRHRHFSYSELSQRYVPVAKYPEIEPPLIVAQHRNTMLWDKTMEMFDNLNDLYNSWVQRLQNNGASRKEARQAARWVLPESKETRIVVTGNYRSWMEFLEKRNNPHADAAIQELARIIETHLIDEAPNIFANPVLREAVRNQMED